MSRRLDVKSSLFLPFFFMALALCALTGCETKHAATLNPVVEEIPEAQPCADGCPEGTVCVPGVDDEGVPGYMCVNVHIRYCAPCMEDSDCMDPLMPGAGSLCVGWDDGSGSFCATDCSQHADCPSGAYCNEREDGRKVCMPEGGECSCSEWAIENDTYTSCSNTNTHGTCQGTRSCEADGLTDCDADTPLQEVCNGVDDNCDGLADDVFPELQMACDGDDDDLCTDGSTVCIDGALACVDESPEGAESCNGLDDDCDGVVDNLDPVMADLQDGVCIGSLKVCLGVDGWEEPDYTLIEKFEVGEEVTCDDLDNDCDGESDEPYLAGGTVTYTDPSGATDLVKGEPCGVGACAGGEVVCGEDGASLACSTGDLRVVEICDGIDNDCDGEIDEDLTPQLGDRQDGVCMGAVRTCQGVAGWVEPDYALIDGFELDEVSCDGLDNDCDGEEDELFVAGGSITYTDLDGTTGLVKGQACGAGACGGGTVVCGDDALSLTCSTVGLAADEVCDGDDNDCNGSIDDALTEPEATLQAGVCAGSLRVCGGAEGWVEPNYASITGYEATELTCDGLDNDCNGGVDDGLTAPAASMQAGVCGGSVQVCFGSAGWIEPVYNQVEGYELTELTCDGLDNDCDGQIDEALMAPVADVQAGVCAGSQKVCSGVQGWLEPDYGVIEHYEQQEVSCDGRDNDCDGLADNGLVAPAAPLNTGVCAGQVMICGGVNGWYEPAYGAVAGYEFDELTCDGLDNDCDGLVDEGLGAPLADIQSGVCAGANKVCGGEAGWLEPSYAAIAGFEAIEATCDDLDNDCDGETDEGLDAPPAAVQVGVCAGALQVCDAGVWVEPAYDTVAGYEADELTCDGLDNDCDGEADETLSAPASDLQSGVCVDSVKVCAGTDGWIEPDYTLVEGYEPEEQTCDDLDNDCDGETDELYAEDGVVTFADTNGTTDLVLGDSCGAGACSGGVVACAPDGESLTCSSWGEVEVETCNGIDDDCDGSTDEGLSAPDADFQAGVCSGTVRVCNGSAGWGEPDYSTVAGYEPVELSCDGLDNDCDGESDEALTAPDSELQSGVCVNSVKVCGASEGWLEPDYTLLDGFEAEEQTCDGIDNDCDGSVDELFAEGGMIAFTDADGTAGLVLGDACGAGACNGGVVACSPDGQGLTCTSWGDVEAESCNGVDDDCDGITDEGLSAPAANLQSGVCAGSARVCGGSAGWLEPAYSSIAGYEGAELSCDGLDNDCDGQVDESLVAPPASLTVGVCAGSVQSCTGAGGWVQPNYGAIAGYQVDELTCDGLDNDCDGSVDEGYDLSSDVNNCGSCGNTCVLPNATAACSGGGCVIAACEPGFEDCNGIAADGCEIYVVNDVDNCGSCGNVCTNAHGGLMCSGGQCAPTCDDNWADCNGDFDNGFTDGCETQLGTLTDCGTCGDACNAANGYPNCEPNAAYDSGEGNPDNDGDFPFACGIESCGYGYCDMYSNISGCEFPINTYSFSPPLTDVATGDLYNLELAGELAACGDSNTFDLDSISADEGGYYYMNGGIGEAWFKIRMAETSGAWFGTTLGAVFTLDPGGFTDYDLYVYEDACGGSLVSSATFGGGVDQVTLSWGDNWLFGEDDSRDFYVFVKFYEAAPFSDPDQEQTACYGWGLFIDGWSGGSAP